MSNINPDLQKERDAGTFNVEKLTNIIDGDATLTKRRRDIHARCLREPLFTEGEDYHFLSREDQFNRAVQKGVLTWKLISQEGYLGRNDVVNLLMIAFPSESPPISLHWVMFIPTLQGMTSEEQYEKWMPNALRGELIGTYAQTELGHGTNLRQLETTATYDPKTEEFIIHSPTITSMKWWPGGLGKSSNCCIVMANLVTQGKDHGMHPFFVQIRSSEDHKPMPGVTVGDIGPKFGYNTIDNGFLKFDNFHIPRENMLMKYSEVKKDGTYISTSVHKKPSYGVMTLTRAGIVERNAARGLASCVTIAIRYSAVRHQSELKPGAPEPQILDYQTQQYKLFPYLAMSYGFLFASRSLWPLYDRAMALLESGNDTLLPEVHALSAGLKAYCSSRMNVGMEQCRLACGGHGYSQASGLPKLYVANTPACTYEGENTVLLLQTARYLLKSHQQITSGSSVPDSVSYLAQRGLPHSSISQSLALSKLIECYQHRARLVTHRAVRRVDSLKRQGMEDWRSRNESGVELVRAAEAHSELFIMRAFIEATQSVTDPDLAKVVTQLCQLLGAYWMDEHSGDFLEDDFLSRDQIKMIRSQMVSLLADIRLNAVALVDAFDFPDHYLCSALGRYDGQVYQHLYEWAQKSPLNKTQVHESYHKYLKPMITSSKL